MYNMYMKKYTVYGGSDGFGAQYQARLSGIAFCNHNNYEYVHTPFQYVHHGETAGELNKFIGIPDSKGSKPDIYSKGARYIHYSKRPSIYYTHEVLQKIRGYYYSTEKPDIVIPDIAIHIRRGDVDKNCAQRYTSNTEYIDIIDKLTKLYPDYKITIFSQGTEDDFKELQKPNVNFQLNMNLMETFHSMVRSKVFVMAKSSLSYCAGLLNENIVHYPVTFWHRKLDHWKCL